MAKCSNQTVVLEEWDTMAEAARFALEELIAKGDRLADLIDDQPSPQAIIKAALEKATGFVAYHYIKGQVTDPDCIRDLSSNEAVVASIMQRAREYHG